MPICCGKEFPTQFSLDLHRDGCDAWREGGVSDPEGTQTCKSCLIRKDLSLNNFNKHLNRKCGFSSKCKDCTGARSKIYRENNIDNITAYNHNYYELNRATLIEKKSVHYYENRGELLRKKKEYAGKNSEKIYYYMREYRHDHVEELRAKSYSVRSSIVNGILDYLGAECESCNEKEREFLTVDHIDNDGKDERHLGSVGWKRKILHGKSDPSKYRVLCHSCNLSRYRANPIHHKKIKQTTGNTKKCPTCLLDKDESLFHFSGDHLYYECSLCKAFRRLVLRTKAISSIGKVCNCCGESNISKLSFDHMSGDGSSRRKIDKPGDVMARRVINKLMDDIQVLCFNCNYSSHVGHGTCIHKRVVSEPPSLTGRKQNTELNSAPLVDFDFSDVSIKPSIPKNVEKFLSDHHYGGFGRGAHSAYSVTLHGEIIAVVKFASVVRIEVATSMKYKPSDLLELDRFCIHPARHKKNFATYIMSRVLKQTRKDNPGILGVVSFADPRFGHSGFIYRASNWSMLGMTASSYYYLDSNGGEINKKTLYNAARIRKMKEREYANLLKLKRVSTAPKIKYFYKL